MNIKRSCYLIGICISLAYTAVAQQSSGTLVDKIVAKIDNQIILQSELEAAYQQYLSRGGQEAPDVKCELLGELMLKKALLAKAKQQGIVVKREVAQALTERMRYLVQQVGSEEGLAQYLGKPIKEIKRELRAKLKEKLLYDRMHSQIIKDVTVTPQEVKDFFEGLPVQERPYYPAEVVVRQIVQYPQVSSKEKDALIAQLKALKVRLQNGERFEDLARAYSQDPGSASQGGALGFWRLGELAPEYEAAALALQPGEVSDPVVTQFGIHLIQLTAQEQDRYDSRHILLRPDPEHLDIAATKASLTQLRAAILAGKLTFEQAAQTYSKDTLTAARGGLVIGKYNTAKMAIDDLPSDIFFAIEQLAPGDISEPVVFTTPDNQEAIRVLLLEEKVAPHQASLVQDYVKIQQYLINEKRETALQAWFEGIKTSASIEVAPEYQHCDLFR